MRKININDYIYWLIERAREKKILEKKELKLL